MPVVVTCRCGQRFAAEDRLIGQQVACPVCGSPLTISAASPTVPAAAAAAAGPGIRVDCRCGRAFLAPESMRGQQARCPGCGGVIQIPATEAAGLTGAANPLAVAAVGDPLQALRPHASEPDEIPWETLKLMAWIGGAIFVLIAIITTVINYSRTSSPAAAAKPPAAAVAPKPSAPAVAPKAVPPPPPADSDAARSSSDASSSTATANPSDQAATPSATGFGSPTRPDSVAVARLPDGALAWYEQPATSLTGIRRAGSSESPLSHFSWMTRLLPFLGHAETYERIDFNQPLTKGVNLQVGAVLIPEFLNPLDDRQRWKGYPFDGIALTHFVGMSGVEDARNVVAAKLPRSDPRAGVFGYDEVARGEQITDGTSQTMMIVGAGALSNPWIFGGGATIRGAREPLFDQTSGLGTKGLTGGGTIAVMADGSVRHVTADVDPRVFRAMCTIHGGDSVDVEKAARPYALESLKGR